MQKTDTKNLLENLYKKYEVTDFIKDDPIQFPHLYTKREDIEIAGFLASLFAYGNRTIFCKKLNELFKYMGNSPHKFIMTQNFNTDFLNNFDYRFSKGIDLIQILTILKELYQSSSLMELFEYGYSQKKDVKFMFQTVIDYFYARTNLEITSGFYHLLPNPNKNSAMKRMCMFLRWMVRKSEVDFGIWKFIPTSELLIPLDVHVARLSRELKLLTRGNNDFNAVLELMKRLKSFDKNDPVKYDFALFGYGIEASNNK
ncbi:TIGR02757 family protein [bacterium]|nr:TIGR02757 family protein [bacterium]